MLEQSSGQLYEEQGKSEKARSFVNARSPPGGAGDPGNGAVCEAAERATAPEISPREACLPIGVAPGDTAHPRSLPVAHFEGRVKSRPRATSLGTQSCLRGPPPLGGSVGFHYFPHCPGQFAVLDKPDRKEETQERKKVNFRPSSVFKEAKFAQEPETPEAPEESATQEKQGTGVETATLAAEPEKLEAQQKPATKQSLHDELGPAGSSAKSGGEGDPFGSIAPPRGTPMEPDGGNAPTCPRLAACLRWAQRMGG